MLQTISIPHWWHTITPTPIGKSQHRGSRETLITTIQFKSPVLVQWIIQHHFFNNHTHLVQMGLKEKPHHPSIQQYTPISYLVVLFAIAEAFSAAKPRMPRQERGIQEGYLNTFMDIKMPLGVLIQHRWKLIWCDIVGNTAKALRCKPIFVLLSFLIASGLVTQGWTSSMTNVFMQYLAKTRLRVNYLICNGDVGWQRAPIR